MGITAAAQAAIDEAVDKGLLPDDDATIRVWERMARQGQPVEFALELMGAQRGIPIAAAASYDDGDDEGLDPEFAALYPPQTPREARRRQTRVAAAAEVRRDHASEEDDWRELYPPSEKFRP